MRKIILLFVILCGSFTALKAQEEFVTMNFDWIHFKFPKSEIDKITSNYIGSGYLVTDIYNNKDWTPALTVRLYYNEQTFWKQTCSLRDNIIKTYSKPIKGLDRNALVYVVSDDYFCIEVKLAALWFQIFVSKEKYIDTILNSIFDD